MSRRSSNDGVTTTSYAMLGMLAIRPWTTYELAKHMDKAPAPLGESTKKGPATGEIE